MSKVALLILFNHNYEKNLTILDKIYKERFNDIWYIMPFYEGNREDVITVYENSHYFQAYIAKAIERIYNSEFEHYLIISDDLLLNPNVNQNNYQQYFAIDKKSAFIPGMFLLNNPVEMRPNRPLAPFWPWTQAAINFKIDQPGIQVSEYLPSYEQAKMMLSKHGLNFSRNVGWKMFYSKYIWKGIYDKGFFLKHRPVFVSFKNSINFSKKLITYPLVGSYSDIVIVPQKSAKDFIKYCGIFGALNLFVEIALPTALAFSAEKIVSEDILTKKGITLWNPEDVSLFETEYDLLLSKLTENFPANALYVHPIKFSRWRS